MMIRRAALIAASVSALSVVPMGAAGARPTGAVHLGRFDRQLVNEINHQREVHGLSALAVSRQLSGIASAWARHMATTGRAQDNPHLGAQVTASCPHWKALGELVDNAGHDTAARLWQTYSAKPSDERVLMLRPATDLGIRTVTTYENGARVEWNVIDLSSNCD
ncbi:MAG TPA: CAP domain-containing protein [Mycobacteriales bacterium]|nr:CAP domain-containing protein [Mycobacteriales bacterium]